MMKSQERSAVIIEFKFSVGKDTATATIAKTKMTMPNTLHLPFFIPKSPKIPAKSIKTLTVADTSAGILRAMIALIAESGAQMPQIM